MKSNRIEISYNDQPCYDILLERDFASLPERIKKLDIENRKLCVVSDSNVAEYHLNACMKSLEGLSAKLVSFVFEAGEARKNLDTVQDLYEFLILEKFDRNDILIALGGGVVGDLTGYTAATYLRGIRFVQVPTSLLAMVDSSIGGKTGVDFRAYKNMVGAFHMPQFVYMNVSLLSSLPDREYYSGFGEIIKHGIIKDIDLYNWLRENRDALMNRCMDEVTEMIYRSLLVKKAVVEKDPTEKGDRALLNFGHTIGHAIEKLKDFSLLHGECVAIGMVAASRIAVDRGLLTESDLKQIIVTIQSFNLPVNTCGLNYNDILEAASRDKKSDAGKIKFILAAPIGNAFIDKTVTADEMRAGCDFVL